MTFGELKDEVLLKLQDTSEAIQERIPDLVNDAVQMIIEEADVPGFKKLATVKTVTNQAYTNLPSDCSRVLYVGSEKGKYPIISLEEMLELYPTMDEEGDILCVAVDGPVLYYQKIPGEQESLTVLYRRLVKRMVNDDEEPEGIPSELHRMVIVPKAAQLGFDLFEDGVENPKVNTLAQKAAYLEGLELLRAWCARRRVHMSRSVWNY